MAPFGKKKGGKNEVVFQVHVHSIEPWPAQAGSLTVAWERGTSHKGSIEACRPAIRSSCALYDFEETLVVPCTLTQVQAFALLLCSLLHVLKAFYSRQLCFETGLRMFFGAGAVCTPLRRSGRCSRRLSASIVCSQVCQQQQGRRPE